ncbi:MAG: DUF1844 domain-containing protein [Pseudomonadota bacterium]
MSEQEFVVKDRRRLSPDGEKAEETTRDPKATSSQGGEKKCRDREPPLPELTFSTFVLSLGTSALMNMGEIPDPQTGETCRNLALAKQTVDILAMLQARTKGNLQSDEDSLLTNLLYELRMKYVAAVRK